MRPLAQASRIRRRKFVLVDHQEYEVPELEELKEQAHRRIVSVVPLLTRIVKVWLKRCHQRERSQYDVDDILQEIWVELLKKDRYWDSGRGKYTTYAAMIAVRYLTDLRNQCHLVRSPRDTAARLERLGTEKAETLECIRRSMRQVGSITADMLDQDVDPTFDAAANHDIGTLSLFAIGEAVRRLKDKGEIRTLIWTYGLFDCEPLPIPQQAERTGSTIADIILLKSEAERKLAKLLEQTTYAPL